MMKQNNLFYGPAYLGRGLAMLMEPGLRRFVLVPLCINLFIFAVAIIALVANFSTWVDVLLGTWLPDWDWVKYLSFILWPLFAVLLVLMVYYGFAVVANLIAAPFNGILSERVEERVRGYPIVSQDSLFDLVVRTLAREIAKLIYYIPRLCLLLLLSFVPVINFIVPVLWFLLGSWMMAIQYIDYPMDNNGVSFKTMRSLLAHRRWSAFGFGTIVQLGLMMPLLNLILMPAAVIGATLFWIEEYEGEKPSAPHQTSLVQLSDSQEKHN